MKHTRIALALAVGVVAAGVAAAVSAENQWADLFDGSKSKASAQAQANHAVLAKAAWREVAARKATTLGMAAPLNLPAYAPIFPDGLVLSAAMDDARATAGSAEYAAAAPVGVMLEFYRQAAAQAKLPVRTAAQDANGNALFVAGDGRRTVSVKLTKQFANGTTVDLSYG